MPRDSEFSVGQRVYDKRDPNKTEATLLDMKRNTNGSPKWLCQYPEGRYWVWEVDLRKAETGAGVRA